METRSTNAVRERLEGLSATLREVDRRLLQLAGTIPADSILAGELRGGIEVVRGDLLGDAIETLTSLAELDDATAVQRYLEAAERLERAGYQVTAQRPVLDRAETVAEYLIARHSCLDQEILGALYVDVQQRLIADVEIFRGTLSRMAVEPRVVLRQALERGAASFLLWHTHPSGDPSPTPEDLRFTQRLSAGAQLLGIGLLDHLILATTGRWVSLKRRGGWSDGGAS